MQKRDKIWLFSWPLRILMGLCAFAFFAIFSITWGFAISGNTELAFDMIDIEGQYPLLPWQIMIGIVCEFVLSTSLIIIFLSVNSFLHTVQKKGFFVEKTSASLKKLGYGIILFWLGMVLTDTISLWALTKNLDVDLQEPFEWLPFDTELIALIVGFVLVLMSKALNEARAINNEYKQIV